MGGYSPHTDDEIATMLRTIGTTSVDELFSSVPAELRRTAGVRLPPGLNEPALRQRFEALAARNRRTDAFLGVGAYPHLSPGVVDQILLRSEFATAYTPYQPEVSQGTLQAIFEFQTFGAMLLGLDVANASMYDGASATAEAVLMARRLLPKRNRVLIARSLHPHYRDVVRTYLRGLEEVLVEEVPFAADGRLDLDALRAALGDDVGCVVAGYPNVFGVLDDLAAVATLVHAAGGLAISATMEPLALAMVRSPGASGVDIAVAEGQSFGLPVSFGGPGVGLMASREQHVRAMPGRLVGETVDAQGRRGFVLTLATREQHIRRERATSNICTNQGLCSLAVTVYLSMLGRQGLRRLADTNYRVAHGVAERLAQVGHRVRFAAPFFNEFVVDAPALVADWDRLAAEKGLVVGFPLGRWYPELPDALAVCVTEVHGQDAIGRLLDAAARPAAGLEVSHAR
jgi:glycine dehydrogenase subunit 1